MEMRRRRRRGGAQERGRECFGRRSSTPNQPPPGKERNLAGYDDTPNGLSIESPTTACLEAAGATGAPYPVLEHMSSWIDGSFNVRRQLDVVKNSGDRRRWLDKLLYGEAWSAEGTDDPECQDLNHDEDTGAGIREPLPKPLLPLTGVAMAEVDPNGEWVLA